MQDPKYKMQINDTRILSDKIIKVENLQYKLHIYSLNSIIYFNPKTWHYKFIDALYNTLNIFTISLRIY